ncbi:protein javelin isoform X2 [Episyrphus balteatus]|uniref:protein javelin isoform X2 n=1 Tax=Episyrphus balteatus TaxID=286459 RepID=UPI0024854E03|nr:protein javelin isoform X2 [Episyrphus balteatus]
MVNGYSRSSQTRKDKRKTKEYTFNYVDRVRLGQSSLQKQYRPPCGSGWRQKSISNLDLSTNRHSSSHYIEEDRRLRPSRSLDYKHTTHKEDTLDIAEFYWRIDPEKDYEKIQHNYVDESGYHSTNLYNQQQQQQPFDIGNESCSLRRSRSLAVIREETFSDLQISSANSHHRRSQLIPRARFTSSKQPTYYHHHHHQHHHHQHQSSSSSTLDRALAASGDTPHHSPPPILVVAQPPETTTITRESDEYYENLKRLDAHQQSIWQNEKSDLESLNSEYFRNSLHQSDSNCGGTIGGGVGREEKQRLYQSRSHKSTSHRKYSSQFCGEESSCPELSQSSVFPETTTTSNSDDQSDSLTVSEQEYDIERVEEILSKVYNEKFEVISLTEEQNQKRSENTDEQGALIAYDSVYLSSEESSEGTLVEGGKQETPSLLHISIEDIYDPPERPEVIEEKPIENPLYSQVHRIPSANQSVDTKPKILALVEKKKKLKRFSDYAVVPRRESKGVIEHLTYVSAHNTHQLIDNQYFSLPDVNIGKSLKVSERIDAKLRSSYNIKEESPVPPETITDSIKRFGRAHKKVRQREEDNNNTNYRSEIEEVEVEKPRGAASIQVETFTKEIIATETDTNASADSNTFIELSQFRIIVTDAQNNIIEEDSIDGNSVPSLPTSLDITEVQQSVAANGSQSKSKQQQENQKEDKLIEQPTPPPPPPTTPTQPKKSTLCRTPSKSKKSTGTVVHSEVCKAKDRRLYGTYRARPIKVKPNDSLRRVGKMSRPQVIQVVDSKKSETKQQQQHPLAGKQAEDEFLQKVDAIRCYWSKMSEEINQQKNKEILQQKDEEKSSKKDFIIGDEVKCVKPTPPIFNEDDFTSLMPSIEIVELDGDKQATIVKANADEPVPEFDHIRYKVMKPNLFRSNILNRSKKEAQFDGLIQYLQEYSFQELLTNNNVVIVEPVRTKIERPSKDLQFDGGYQQQQQQSSITKGGQNCKITGGAGNNSCHTSLSTTNSTPIGVGATTESHNKLSKRHFFYQPVRVNRELLEEELPTPDTVRNVRKFFEENVLPNGSKQRDESGLSPEVLTNDRQLNNNEGRRATGHQQRLRYLTIDTSYGNGQVNNNNNNNQSSATITPGTLRKWDSVSLSSGISSGDLSSPCECSNGGASTVDGRRSPSAAQQHLHQRMKDDNNEPQEAETEIRGGMHVRDFIRRHNACGSQDSNGLCGYYMDGGEDCVDGGGVEGERETDDLEDEEDDEVDMVDDELCESYYVSEDVLEKIRECGSTVTYYGGRVMMHSPPATGATLRIPRSKIEFLTCNSCQPNECPHKDQLHDQLLAQQNYTGIKFKLVKSNSCSSRLELIGTQKHVGNHYPDTIGEDDSIDDNNTGTTNNDEYDDGEPLVRRLVHRLETTGNINKYTGPRIIESQCIEKIPHRRPTSLVVERQKTETTANHKRFSEGFTINNQMVGKIPEQNQSQASQQVPKQVTVNNHINVPIESSLSSPCFTSSAMDIRLVEKAGGIEQAKLANGKIRRNKNVDLAFTMKGPNGTLKNVSSSSGVENFAARNNTTSEKTDRNYRNSAKDLRDLAKNFNITEHFDGHLPMKQKDEELTAEPSSNTTGKTSLSSSTPSELIVDKTLVRHYVTNDKRLFSKPKYDDIEFEEFEVYDPLKDATAKAEQLVDGLAEDITRAVSATSSYELKSSSTNNDECCYDSLDDKI